MVMLHMASTHLRAISSVTLPLEIYFDIYGTLNGI